MDFLRKHRFKIVLSGLSILLIIVSFYMLWVHVPYAQNQNRLHAIRDTILKENQYQYKEYFNEYIGESTYYILKVTKDKEEQYVVFDQKQKYLESFVGEVIEQKIVEQDYFEKYQVEADTVEISYEDGLFMYHLTSLKEGMLIYAFYGLETGEFIKAYQFGQ